MTVVGSYSIRTAIRVVLFVVDAFVAVTAAVAAVIFPLGWEAQVFPHELLLATSTDGSFSRGVLLALAVSGSATIAAFATMHGPRSGGALSAFAGLVLLSEMLSQLVLLDLPGQPTGAELLYLAAGLAMVAFGALAFVRVRPTRTAEPAQPASIEP